MYKELRKIIIPLSLLLGCILLITHLSIEPLYTPTAVTVPAYLVHLPKICAHKSIISNRYKGNTLQAIQEALASYIEAIEVDVRLSKDHVPFLYHGDTLEVYTNGNGKPEDHDWAYLAQLTYNDGYPSRLLSFEDLLTLVGSQKFIFLDIKLTFRTKFLGFMFWLILV